MFGSWIWQGWGDGYFLLNTDFTDDTDFFIVFEVIYESRGEDFFGGD